ncbi:IS3 family transposase [Bacillus pseudomycoides]
MFQYYNHKRITVKLKGMNPLQYRIHAQRSYLNSLV